MCEQGYNLFLSVFGEFLATGLVASEQIYEDGSGYKGEYSEGKNVEYQVQRVYVPYASFTYCSLCQPAETQEYFLSLLADEIEIRVDKAVEIFENVSFVFEGAVDEFDHQLEFVIENSFEKIFFCSEIIVYECLVASSIACNVCNGC